jgi:hypothetical protein
MDVLPRARPLEQASWWPPQTRVTGLINGIVGSEHGLFPFLHQRPEYPFLSGMASILGKE